MSKLPTIIKLALFVHLNCTFIFAQTAPTRAAAGEGANWNSATTPKTTASLSWNTGNVICAMGTMENTGDTLNLATATGLTFVNQLNLVTVNYSPIRVDCVQASSSGSSAISMTRTGSTNRHWGFAAWVYSGTAGIGTCTGTSSGTTARTLAQTNTAAHSAVIWGVTDWNAGGAPTGTPTPTTVVQSEDDGSFYSLGVFDLTDQTSAGSVNYGITGSGTSSFNIAICEIKGQTISSGQVGVFLVGP